MNIKWHREKVICIYFAIRNQTGILDWQNNQQSMEFLSSNGALNPNIPISILDTSGGALTMTLGNCTSSFLKEIRLRFPVESATITFGGSQYILDPSNPAVKLYWDGGSRTNTVTNKWHIIDGHSYVASTQQQKLTASDIAASDWFGWSCTVTADGNRCAIGALNEGTTGAVYIYTRTNTTWTQEAKITASDGLASDQFGASVVIDADGNTLVIGAYGVDGAGTDRGAVYVFTRSGTTWSQQQKITPTVVDSAQAGVSVDISSDGNRVIIGAPADTGGAATSGAAYTYTRSGTTWTLEQKINGTATGDWFGGSVSISADSNFVAIGAYLVGATNTGTASVYRLIGTTWTLRDELVASDTAANDWFGISVSLSGDGSTLLVGAYGEDAGGSAAGAVYVFVAYNAPSGDRMYSQQQKLLANDAAANYHFGHDLQIAAEGNACIIGSVQQLANPSGAEAVYIFTRSNGVWTQRQKLTASDAASLDYFGRGVAINAYGNTIVAGAFGEDGGAGNPYSAAGAAYVFI